MFFVLWAGEHKIFMVTVALLGGKCFQRLSFRQRNSQLLRLFTKKNFFCPLNLLLQIFLYINFLSLRFSVLAHCGHLESVLLT